MRAILVEVVTRTSNSHIEEARDIASELGYEVVQQFVQRRDSPDPAYCVGAGKLDEIKKLVTEKRVDVVVFTRQLSVGQVFRIKKALGGRVEVLDRNLLILKVFDLRSTTAEAKLQVELAKLRYTFSWGREAVRSRGIVGEQVGRGGPGTYPYREYEAATRKRISKIERELRAMRARKGDVKKRRRSEGFSVVALAGYTQSGKTTLFNTMTGEGKVIGLGPFTTLSTFARKITFESRVEGCILVDSIGFIEDLNVLLLNAFHTTLSEIASADLILLLVDGSEPVETVTRKAQASRAVMATFLKGIPYLVCVNKADAASREHLDQVRSKISSVLGDARAVLETSAKTGQGLTALCDIIKLGVL